MRSHSIAFLAVSRLGITKKFVAFNNRARYQSDAFTSLLAVSRLGITRKFVAFNNRARYQSDAFTFDRFISGKSFGNYETAYNKNLTQRKLSFVGNVLRSENLDKTLLMGMVRFKRTQQTQIRIQRWNSDPMRPLYCPGGKAGARPYSMAVVRQMGNGELEADSSVDDDDNNDDDDDDDDVMQ